MATRRGPARQDDGRAREHGDGAGEFHHEQQIDAVAPAMAERARDHQHRDHQQILRDQHAHGDAAGMGVKLADLLQHLDADGGRGQREHEAEDERALKSPTQQRAGRPGEAEGNDGLQGDAEQRDAIDGAKGLEVQLEADEEEKQQHAEFGKEVDALRALHQAETMGAEHHAGEDVADDGGLAQADQHETAAERDDDQQGDGIEVEGFFHDLRAFESAPSSRRRTPSRRATRAGRVVVSPSSVVASGREAIQSVFLTFWIAAPLRGSQRRFPIDDPV